MSFGGKGWVIDPKCACATFYGEWLRIVIHDIDGFEPHEWFVTCTVVGLDCFKLTAPDLEAAKEEGRRLAFKMTQRYQTDLLVAFRTNASAVPA